MRPFAGAVPRRLFLFRMISDTRRRRGVYVVSAARVIRRRRDCDRGRCLRVHAAQEIL
jgi:hypothetical protein